MLTPDQKEQVFSLYVDGFSVEDIADQLYLNETDVLDYVDELEQDQL